MQPDNLTGLSQEETLTYVLDLYNKYIPSKAPHLKDEPVLDHCLNTLYQDNWKKYISGITELNKSKLGELVFLAYLICFKEEAYLNIKLKSMKVRS